MLKTKEKKYLRGLANTQKAIFQIGKDGLSDNLIEGIDIALTTHELIKIHVLKSCVSDVREIAFDLSSNTNSEIVQIIGKMIVLYRVSKDHIIKFS